MIFATCYTTNRKVVLDIEIQLLIFLSVTPNWKVGVNLFYFFTCKVSDCLSLYLPIYLQIVLIVVVVG